MAWNKPNSNTVDATSSSRPTGRGKTPRLRLILAGVAVVVALGALCLWMFSGGEEAPKAKVEKERGRIKEAKSVSVQKSNVPVEKVATEGKYAKKDQTAVKIAEPTDRRAPRGTPRIIAEAAERGERVTPIFKFASENYLALYAVPGEEVPPTPEPDNFEQDMANALVSQIEIEDGDTDEIIDRKKIVAGMKEELKSFIREGGTLAEYMEQVKKRQAEEAKLYNEAFSLAQRTARAENADPAEALEVWSRANAELAEKGIPPVPMPRRLRTYLTRNTSWDGTTPLVEGMKTIAPKNENQK